MSDPPVVFAPCLCGGFGSLTALIFSACFSLNGCLPVIIGAGIGSGIGCVYCIGFCILEIKEQNKEQTTVKNIYFEHQDKVIRTEASPE